ARVGRPVVEREKGPGANEAAEPVAGQDAADVSAAERAGDQPLAAARDIRDVEGVAALAVPALVHDPGGAPAGEGKLAHACPGARVVGGAGGPAGLAGGGRLS